MSTNLLSLGRLSAALLAGLLVLSPALGSEAVAQDIRGSLFAEADAALKECMTARADILVPKLYGAGMKNYRKAEDDLKKGKNLEGIRKDLQSATASFRRSLEGVKLANVTLAASLAARDDAQSADAPKHAAEQWRKADRKFTEAAEKLEDGDVKGAQRRSAEAETLFREAELDAIKQSFLNETWGLLERAERDDVKKRAPATLHRAGMLTGQADKALTENRYDADEPRSLAQEAKYEAQHALYLASVVEKVEKKDLPLETLLLNNEKPLQSIAGALDILASFEEGMDRTTAAILKKIVVYQDSLQRLNSKVAEGSEQIASQEARIKELEADLGGVQRERSQLAERMAAQARIREKFVGVERMFDREQARVLREGNDIIIRVTGLTFNVGKADIDPQFFGLLTTVQRAIGEFPGARLSVEGHTDSFGGDQSNLELSQKRADAVRKYLLANMRLEPAMVDAIGYGETRPVASNETREGRTRNRRIEIIIHPELGTGSW